VARPMFRWTPCCDLLRVTSLHEAISQTTYFMQEPTLNLIDSPNESKPSWRNPLLQRRLRELDGLRGAAILMVVSFHYLVSISAPRFQLWEWATRSMGLFQTGVDLFFVLSGFLISGILIDSRASPHFFKTFYARRIHRIFPLYYGWLGLFYLGLVFNCDQKWGVHLFTIAQNAPLWIYPVFLQNNAGVWFGALTPTWVSVTWSLAVEEQFYAILPAIVRAVDRAALGWGAAVVIVISPLLRILVHTQYAWQFSSVSRMDALATGAGIAVLIRSQTAWHFLRRTRKIVGLAAAYLLITSLAASYGIRGIPLDRFTAVSIFYGLVLILAVCHSDGRLCSVLRNSVLAYFGRISYAVYIFHVGVRSLTDALIPAFQPNLLRVALVVMLSAGVTILLAQLSWQYVERKLIARAHRVFHY